MTEAKPLSGEALEAIRERAKRATPPPWRAAPFVDGPATDKLPAIAKLKVRPIQRTALGSFEPDDAQFIAHARTDIPALLGRIAELEAALAFQVKRTAFLAKELGFTERGIADCTSQARAVLQQSKP